MRLGNTLATLVVVWLLIGAVAVWQRGYLSHAEPDCASAGTIALTVLAGPLNYGGLNPKVSHCQLPEPSALSPLAVAHLGME
ncbi:hypothetical protein KV112_03440 [Mycolicibacter sp. MYC123]|uniref:Uncharacterized protein n=1 Tax=[Mycobacterium] zoologicum TaxID=2872311 RepID=A0ABU5YFH0_9MYCO|nr:hypothetical protein [Mycolicibacter sp. MYC123]MEB3048799.1 hypothetical protein [Mycolicibacter sp. MYC123]